MSEETRKGVPLAEQDRLPEITIKTLGGSSTSNVRSAADDSSSVFSGTGGIQPPYDPATTSQIAEDSALLRPNIDAYVQNIDGSGHRFEKEIDPEADDADEKIRAAIRVEKMRSLHWRIAAAGAEMELFEATDAEVFERKERLRRLMVFEEARLKSFFKYCARGESFTSLRMRTRKDLEEGGNGYWEILRGALGDIAQFVYVAGYTIRLMPIDKEFTEYRTAIKITDISYDEQTECRRFRRFVQVIDQQTVFFKEFGDRRIMSRKKGLYFKDMNAWKAHIENQADDGMATELLHFRLHSARSPYGVPRWIGASTEILGARHASVVNHDYFENKAVPPMAILVSGGRLREENVKMLEDHIKNEIKGARNFHKPLLLEAVSMDRPGSPTPQDAAKIKIQIIPLMNAAQMKDALFMGYTLQNKQLVREQFRNPPIMVGDSKDYNRSTSENAMLMAENQVYSAPRDSFDDIMNRQILPDMGIATWRFQSNSIVTKNPQQLSEMLMSWLEKGGMTPEEVRTFAADVFGSPLKTIDDVWVTQPWPLTLAQTKVGQENTAGGPNPMGAEVAQDATGEDPLGIAGLPNPARDAGGLPSRGLKANPARLKASFQQLAQELIGARDALLEESRRGAAEDYVLDKGQNAPALTNGAPEADRFDTLLVTQAEMLSWVEPDPN